MICTYTWTVEIHQTLQKKSEMGNLPHHLRARLRPTAQIAQRRVEDKIHLALIILHDCFDILL